MVPSSTSLFIMYVCFQNIFYIHFAVLLLMPRCVLLVSSYYEVKC